MEETFENEKDQVSPICRYRMNLGDFRHRSTMMLKVYINGHKTGENRGKELNNVWMNFSPTCRQKPECQCSTTIYCQHNSIFHRQKKLLFVYLTGQNWGLSRLKNMWQVIMSGDVLSVILNIVRWNYGLKILNRVWRGTKCLNFAITPTHLMIFLDTVCAQYGVSRKDQRQYKLLGI